MQRSWTNPVPQAMQRHTGTWNPSPPKSRAAPGAAGPTPEPPAPQFGVLDLAADQAVRLASAP